MSRTLLFLIPVVLAVGLVPVCLGNELDPSLAGWWKLDEGSGTVTADSSGRGRDGVLVSNPVWRQDGAQNGCLFFDGDLSHVRIPHHDSLNPGAGSFTIVFWANVDPVAGTRGDTTWDLVSNKRDTGSVGYYVGAQRTQGGGAGKTGWRFMLGDTAAHRTDTPFTPAPLGEWVFVAAVLDRDQNAQKLSVDGGVTWQSTTPPAGPIAPGQDFAIGWDIGANNFWFHGLIDDVAMFGRALSSDEIGLIREEGMTPGLAKDPQPGDRAADVPPEVVLNWQAGLYAVTHDVYFGTNPEDVAQASRANPQAVLISQGQAGLTADVGRLALGQRYYWRIDEVGAAPASTIYKGDVWSFTIEPVAYALRGSQIAVTASGSISAEEGPANTFGGLGLDADGLHSDNIAEMWLSGAVAEGESAWIRYEFDKTYSLHQMLVWNHNAATEPLIGLGIKEAAIEYSLDGSDWMRLGDAHEFARAAGKPGAAAGTTIDFGGAAAKYVRITAVSNWGGILAQYGLSEVQFLYIPLSARQPNPTTGAAEVPPQLGLSWRAGRQAASHKVYLSTDEQAVIDRVVPAVTVSEPGFDADMLKLGQTYFWAVDEVNDAAAMGVWSGDVWSFSTLEYFVIEDFESYTDNLDAGEAIYQTWIDGWDNKTGSQVGYIDSPFAEKSLVHGGGQSMPLTYNNTASPFYSEAERTFDEPQDWTTYGVGALTVHFRGALDNTGKLYLKINNTKVPYNGDAADIAKMIWQPWSIDLSGVSANLRNVSSLTIGIEGAGTEGILYIDDIHLYPKAPETTTSVEPNRANLIAYYALDGNADDSSGNGFHGVAVNDPVYVSGVRGQAMQFDGFDDHVRITHQDRLNPKAGSFSITCWAYVDPTAGTSGTVDWDLAVAKREASSRNGYYLGAQRSQGDASQTGWKFMLGKGNAAADRIDTPFVLAPLGEWVFVAGVVDRDLNVQKISVDGGLTWAATTPPAGPIAPATDLAIGWDIGQNNYWFCGTVDEVHLYDEALSDEEVAWLAGG